MQNIHTGNTAHRIRILPSLTSVAIGTAAICTKSKHAACSVCQHTWSVYFHLSRGVYFLPECRIQQIHGTCLACLCKLYTAVLVVGLCFWPGNHINVVSLVSFTKHKTNNRTWLLQAGQQMYCLQYAYITKTWCSPSWAANCSTSHRIPFILWNPRVHYCFHNSMPLVHILNQINPVHTLPSHFFEIYIILTLQSHLCIGLACGLFPSGFTTTTLYLPHLSTIHATCPANIIFLIYYLKNI